MRERWGVVLLKDSSTPIERSDITRWYHKGGCLCLEFTERGPDGRPLIMEIPHESYTYALKTHEPHPCMEPREQAREASDG